MACVRVATLNAWMMGFHLTPANAERRAKVGLVMDPLTPLADVCWVGGPDVVRVFANSAMQIIDRARVAGVDVLALQEVWTKEDREELVRYV
jgi:hypothetical protein